MHSGTYDHTYDNRKEANQVKNFFSKIGTTIEKIPRKIQITILILTTILLLALILVLVSTCLRQDDEDEIITLTYANWNLDTNHDNALELRMIQSFMDQHPNIRIEIDRNISSPWTDSIAAASRDNRMPDVFMVEDISVKAANGWLMDITTRAWADLDFFDLAGAIQEAMRIDNTIYAVPFGQIIQGYFVNRELFEWLGIEPPSFGVSAEDFIQMARAATNVNRPSIGLNSVFSFVEWYPGAVNPLLNFFAFDGLGFALDSPEMLEAVRVAAQLRSEGYVFDGLLDTSPFPSGNALGAFRDGQIAFFHGGTWHSDLMIQQLDFDWEFIGVPGGRSVISLEVLGISSTTLHPDEAYLFAKWMGHGTEGSLRRLQYAREMGIIPIGLPVTQSSEVVDELLQILPVPGLQQVYASLDRALVDGLRVMPGYMQARFTAPTGIDVNESVNIGVDALIRYSIMGYTYFPDNSRLAQDVARNQLDAALAAVR